MSRTVPAVATLLPFYLLMRDIGLLGTTAAVILIDTVLNCAFVTWMMFSYFRALPPELNEAALTDGCTLWGAFVRVELPCARSGLLASALFCLLFFLERLSLRELPHETRQQARLGRPRHGLRHL